MPYTTFSNPQNRECGTFAGPQCTNTLGRFDQLLNFWCRVVRGDITVLVAEQYAPRLKRHPGCPQTAAKGVLQIVSAYTR